MPNKNVRSNHTIKDLRLREEAEQAHRCGRYEEAIQIYRALLRSTLNAEESLSVAINLGALMRLMGLRDAALKHYDEWIPKTDYNYNLTLNALNLLIEVGRVAEARAIIEKAMERNGYSKELANGLIKCDMATGDYKSAERKAINLMRENNNYRDGWISLGVCKTKLGYLEEGLECFEKADKEDEGDGKMMANRINILKDLGRLDDAIAVWEGSKVKNKETPWLMSAYAGVLVKIGKPVEASALYQEACSKQPNEHTNWLNWSSCLKALKHTVATLRVIKRGILYHPEEWILVEALLQCLCEMGSQKNARRAEFIQDQWCQQTGSLDSHIFNRQFLGTAYSFYDSESLCKEARKWERAKLNNSISNICADTIRAERKDNLLRVGYLTSDACNHPVGRFLLSILSCHDKKKVEAVLVRGNIEKDWITDQIINAASSVIDISSISDPVAARVMADAKFDVIVELGGFTGGSRIGSLVYRPCAIQLSYLGYPGPTYLECIDGWIADKEVFAGLSVFDEKAHNKIEIEEGYMAFDPGGEIRLKARSPDKSYRFGSYNHARKLSDEAIDLYVSVLLEIPDSILVLKSVSFCEVEEKERIRARFMHRGLRSERLILLDWIEGGVNHMMSYCEIDVTLDPIPYGGATTTCESLYMGVPVITIAGKGMIGRLSSSVLRSAGCDQWIGEDKLAYIAIAKMLYAEGIRTPTMRKELRDKVTSSSLMDCKRLARELERVYLDMTAKLPTQG